jgi:TPR repeat protein
LAAHPEDTQKLAPGVPPEKIDVTRAARACADALARQPHDGRTLYQMARVALVAKDSRTGLEDMRQAAEAGYAQAQFVLGLMLVRGEGVAPDVCAGGNLWIMAARQRHLYAKLYLAGYWRDGVFTACALAVTEPEITDMLHQADELVADPQQERDLAAARVKWAS